MKKLGYILKINQKSKKKNPILIFAIKANINPRLGVIGESTILKKFFWKVVKGSRIKMAPDEVVANLIKDRTIGYYIKSIWEFAKESAKGFPGESKMGATSPRKPEREIILPPSSFDLERYWSAGGILGPF